MSINKKIFLIWFLYILFICVVSYLYNYFGVGSLKDLSIKEVLFAQWGYAWDGMHYIRISQTGYHFPLQAFFPLYPLLLKFFDLFFPLTLAYRINVVLLLPTLYLLVKFQELFNFDSGKKVQNLIIFLSLPTAFFLQANYTELLFLILSLTILILLKKQNFVLASVVGILFSATKISGVGICPVIFFSFMMHRRFTLKNASLGVLFGALPLIGILSYFYYLNIYDNGFMEFFRAQESWGRFSANYFDPFISSIINWDSTVYRRLSELAMALFTLVLLIKSFRKISWEIWFFCLIQFLIPLMSGSILSYNRFVLFQFPLLFYWFNSFNSKLKTMLFFFVFMILQILFIGLFLNNIFIG